MSLKMYTTISILLFLLSSVCLQAQWSLDNLSSARYNIGIGSSNGKVFFAGSSPFEDAKVVDIYDIETNSWTIDEFAVERQFTFAEGIGDKMYFAGYTQTSAEDQDLIEIYDVPSDTWSTMEMATLSYATSVTSVGDLLVLVHGDEVDMYNTVTDTWITGKLSSNRILALAVGCNGKITFAGGGSFVGGLTDLVDIYDVASDTWSISNLSAGKNGMNGACLNNKIYYVGGSFGFSGDAYEIEIYDTETDTWTLMDMLQEKRTTGLAVTNNNLYILGGRVSANYVTEVEVINGETGERTIDNISTGRTAISGYGVDNRVFAAGGFDPISDSFVTTIDILQEELTNVTHLQSNIYTLSPNPTSSDVSFIENGRTIQKEIPYELYNAWGKLIDTGSCQGEINLTNLSSGVYYINILEESQSTYKVVKF